MKGTPAAGLVLFTCFWLGQARIDNSIHAGMQQDADSAAILRSAVAQNLRSKADQILTRISQLSKDLKLPFVGGDYFIPEWASLDDGSNDSLSVCGKTVVLTSVAYRFTFRIEDGRLASFYDPQVTTFEDGAGAPLFDTPDTPTWTREKAITLATKFRDLLIEHSDAKLGNPSAKYIHTSYEIAKSRSGKPITRSHIGCWAIDWPRTDNAGHPFYGDGVVISLSEKYGICGAGIQLFTPFVEREGMLIAQADAVSAARWHIAWVSFLERHLSSFSSDPYETITGDKLVSNNLIVVIPNHVTSCNPFANPQKPWGRLVWELWFQPIHKGPPTGPTYDDRFSVWVDAYSGEIVGGDAML